MKVFRILFYLWYSPSYNFFNYSMANKYYNNLIEQLKLISILKVESKVSVLNLTQLYPELFFGKGGSVVSNRIMVSLIEYLPKKYLKTYSIFDDYYQPVKVNRINQIPLSYYIFCMWDMLSSLNCTPSRDVRSQIEVLTLLEYYDIEYKYTQQKLSITDEFNWSNSPVYQKELAHYIYHLCNIFDPTMYERLLYGYPISAEQRKIKLRQQRKRFINNMIQKMAQRNAAESCYFQKTKKSLFLDK